MKQKQKTGCYIKGLIYGNVFNTFIMQNNSGSIIVEDSKHGDCLMHFYIPDLNID